MAVFEEVWGRFLAPDGTALSGSVVFTPAFSFARDAQAVTLPAPVTVKLDTEGRVSASLQVPDESTQPTTWTWEACPRLRHAGGSVGLASFSFELVQGQPVNLAEVLPVPDPVTGEYVTQGKPGADGVGLATITLEGGELVFTLTDGSESRLPAPKGVPGDDGKDGVGLEAITLEDGELVFTLTDGAEQRLPAPVGEKGDDGKPGQPGKDGISPPAPTLRVGEVTTLPATATATAEITGEAPDYTLALGVPQGVPGAKGDKGDSIIGPAGPKGEPGNPAALVLVGVGRPDTPSTLSPENRTAVASALVGATFTSTDGAGVGAWAWVKTPGGWQVTYGDTGWRDFSGLLKTSDAVPQWAPGTLLARRQGSQVEMIYSLVWFGPIIPQGLASAETVLLNRVQVPGFDPQVISRHGYRYGMPATAALLNTQNGAPLTGFISWQYDSADVRFHNLLVKHGAEKTASARMVYLAADPWPATLPGTPV